jgi:maltooligosyltrehalose trehalohydrolase
MARGQARVLINFGKECQTFHLLEGEKLELTSREGLREADGRLDLPPMTLAVLMSPSEEVENRQVARHQRE